MYRRQQLPPEPVQPRRAGRAPAGFLVQAVRARDGAEAGISPSTDVRIEARLRSSLGDRYWPVHNYENAYLGSANLVTATIESDNSIYAQLTQLVGPANVAKTATPARDHEPAQVRTSRSASAPRRSTRSTWRVRSRRSRTGAAASTAPRSATAPRAIATRAGTRTAGSSTTTQPRHEPVLTREHERAADVASSRTSSASAPASAPRCRTASGRRQDRHDGELRRRMVRRLHAAARRPPSGSATRRLGRC